MPICFLFLKNPHLLVCFAPASPFRSNPACSAVPREDSNAIHHCGMIWPWTSQLSGAPPGTPWKSWGFCGIEGLPGRQAPSQRQRLGCACLCACKRPYSQAYRHQKGSYDIFHLSSPFLNTPHPTPVQNCCFSLGRKQERNPSLGHSHTDTHQT